MAITTLQPAIPERQGSWHHETLEPDQPMPPETLRRALVGETSGVCIIGVIRSDVCKVVIDRLTAFAKQRRSYAGDLNIDSAMADGVDDGAKSVVSHWEQFYMDSMTWDEYGVRKPGWEEMRKSLTAGVAPDLLDIVKERLQTAWPGPVVRARHPVTGQELYAGILRAGAPRLHADHAPYDLPGMPAVHQLGCNIYINNPGPGGDLRVYRTQVRTQGNTQKSGILPIGNYDLSYDLIEGAEYDVIPVRAGDMVIAPNRYLHDVTPCPDETIRMTFGVHAVMLLDGSLALFS